MQKKLLTAICLTGALLASCSSDEVAEQGNQPFENPIPVTLHAGIGGQVTSRAFVDEDGFSWSDYCLGNNMYIQIKHAWWNEYNDAVVRTFNGWNAFTIDEDGNMQCQKYKTGNYEFFGFYWLYPEDRYTIRGCNISPVWWDGDVEGEVYPQMRDGITVNHSNTADIGVKQTESPSMLYAPQRLLTLSNESDPLMFYHQDAKVVFNIKFAEGEPFDVTSENFYIKMGADTPPSGTTLEDELANPSTPYNTFNCALFDLPESGNYGTWRYGRPEEQAWWYLGPTQAKVTQLPAGSDYQLRAEAIVIPQDFTGKKLFRIRTGKPGKYREEYVYTATEADGANFEPGYKYTYNVVINNGVIVLVKSDWTEDPVGENMDVVVKEEWLYEENEGVDVNPIDWNHEAAIVGTLEDMEVTDKKPFQ